MDDATFVRGVERLGDLNPNPARVFDRERPAHEPRLERLSVDQLHDDDLVMVQPFEAVNRRDVRMIQRREDLRFPSEPRDAVRLLGETVGEQLEGDVAAESRITRAKHSAHAAFAQLPADMVGAERVACLHREEE